MHNRSAVMTALSALALVASACGAITLATPPVVVSSTPVGNGGAAVTPQASAAAIPLTDGTTAPTFPPPTAPPTQTPLPPPTLSGPVPTAQGLPTAPIELLVIELELVQNPQYGAILVDGKGRALYLRTSDQPRVSTCDTACMQIWPPAVPYGRKPTLFPGIDPTKVNSFVRSDGMRQLTFNDWPLYYYSGDTAPGQTNGQGAGGIWHLVSASGEPVP